MRLRPLILLAVLFLATPIILESLAAGPAPVPVSGQNVPAGTVPAADAAARSSLTTLSEAQAEQLSPLNREIRTLLIEELAEVARLAKQLTAVEDPMVALDLQRQISALKTQTQIAILEVQGDFARQEGRVQQAEEIDAAVTLMRSRQEARTANREAR